MRVAAAAILTLALVLTGAGAARTVGSASLCQPVVRTQIPAPKLADVVLVGVAAAPGGSIWAVGQKTGGRSFVLHSTGGRFTTVVVPGTQFLRDVVAPAPDEAWTVGYDTIHHWDGQSWRRTPVPRADLAAASASAPDDVWVVASRMGSGSGALLHWDGRAWKKVPFQPTAPHTTRVGGRAPVTNFFDVLAIAKDDVWVVGAAPWGPLAAHWDGNAWHSVPVPRKLSYFSDVAAGPEGHVWAAGPFFVAEWDGHAWSVRSHSNHEAYNRLLVRGNEVWAILDNKLTRWTGSAWAPLEQFGPDAGLFALTVDAHGEVWAVGEGQATTLVPHVVDPNRENLGPRLGAKHVEWVSVQHTYPLAYRYHCSA